MAVPLAVAAEVPAGWMLAATGASDPELLSVCLYRDASTAGLFSLGAWKATLTPTADQRCELLAADLKRSVLYLAVPDFNRVGEHLNGRADAYGCHSMSDLVQRYSICNSEFFREDPSFGTSMRKLKGAELKIAIREAEVVALLERHLVTMQEQQARAAQVVKDKAFQQYMSAAGAATDLASIVRFEKEYAGNDLAGLIPAMLERRQVLELVEYHRAYAAAIDEAALRAFVAAYVEKDRLRLPVCTVCLSAWYS